MLLVLLAACSDQKLGTFNGAPTAAVLSHQDGDHVPEGAEVVFRGAVSDPDDATHTLTASWYLDDAPACAEPVGDDGATTCALTIPAGAASVLLEVRDPDGASASDKVDLVVDALAGPTVSITTPESGARLYGDLPVELAGLAADADDAAETLSYTWTSSLTGEIGAGAVGADGSVADVVFLGEGTQTLTLTVTDDDGNLADAAVGVTVGPPNTPPVATIDAPTDGDAGRLGDELVLSGTVVDADEPEEALAVSWSSDLDGLLGTSTPTSDGAVTLRTTLGAGTHVLTLTAVDELGAVGSTVVLYTVSGPPTVTIDAPADGTLFAEGEAVEAVGTVADDLDAPDTLAVSWSSDRDGLLATPVPDGAGGVLSSFDTLSPGAHVLTLSATDADGLTGTDSITLLVNGLPTAPGVSLAPDPATSADDLTATVDTASVDPEGDPVSYTWTWLRNGVVSSASTSSVLPASATSRGEVWEVQVTPDDGTHAGPAGSDRVTIDNAVPSLGGVSITPDPATADDTLTCAYTGFSDADGDADRSTFAWTVGSATVGTGATLSSGFARGDLVTCTVTPADGTTTGTPLSAALTIDNSPPAVSTLAISPSVPDTDDTLSVSVATSDADGDAVGLAYAWYVNGRLAGSGSTLSGRTAFDRDDVVYVVLTPDDGTDAGPPATSATVTVANSAPTAPVVAVDPADPVEGVDDLWCEVVTPSTDLDGDPITYTMSWDLDGVSWFGSTTTTWPVDTIDAADTESGDRFTCTAVPDDGTTAGASATATVIVGSADVDYSDVWTPDTAPSYSCAFGLVSFTVSSLTIVDGYPSISVRASGNVGTMTGSFSSATDFTADNYLPGTCDETYTITGSFVDANTLDARLDATYVGSCFGCTSRSWTFTATR